MKLMKLATHEMREMVERREVLVNIVSWTNSNQLDDEENEDEKPAGNA